MCTLFAFALLRGAFPRGDPYAMFLLGAMICASLLEEREMFESAPRKRTTFVLTPQRYKALVEKNGSNK